MKAFQPYCVPVSAGTVLSDYRLQDMLALVRQHKLVLFRGLIAPCRDELLHFCEQQASLLHWNFGPVMEMKVDQQTQNYLFTDGDVPLHWDGAFHQEPRFLLFHCIKAPLPTAGGETFFVNTEMVWENARIEQKKAWSTYTLQFSTEKRAHYGGAFTQRMLTVHPDTGKTILRFAEPVGEDYLNPVSVQIINQSEPRSRAILNQISKTMRQKRVCATHTWQQGDFLLADNFSLLHGRNAFTQPSSRHLRRIQIL